MQSSVQRQTSYQMTGNGLKAVVQQLRQTAPTHFKGAANAVVQRQALLVKLVPQKGEVESCIMGDQHGAFDKLMELRVNHRWWWLIAEHGIANAVDPLRSGWYFTAAVD
ncbi:MAG: hypothetical protein VR64_18195 [Desulfatitalea sp. BRH_c12]|nr:MAG: hypothetical protein VR64_18195 [Desulfatitalea sp. BRH_c12]